MSHPTKALLGMPCGAFFLPRLFPTIHKWGAVYVTGMDAPGLEIRAKIDAEIFKTLILIHGGGSIALLTFLQFLLREAHGNEYEALAYGILWGLVSYQTGIIFAVVYSWLTRKCSLIYDECRVLGRQVPHWFPRLGFNEPWQCHCRHLCLGLSLIAFVAAALAVFCGAKKMLDQGNTTAPAVIQMPQGGVKNQKQWPRVLTVAGLAFDVVGAGLLLRSVMKPLAAQERYWSEKSTEAKQHLADSRKLPYHEKVPLWFARTFGSKDIMDMNAEPFPQAFATNFWALVFLVLGFVLQLVAAV